MVVSLLLLKRDLQPRVTAMKAISLLGVFVLAKVLVLAGRDVPLSPWTPWAYLWQDVLVALLFAAFEHATAPPAVGRLGRLRPGRAVHGGQRAGRLHCCRRR